MKILVTITTGFTLVGGLASVMMNYYRVLTKIFNAALGG